MPEEEFEEHLEGLRGEKPITTSGIIREIKLEHRNESRIEMAKRGKETEPSEMAIVIAGDFRDEMDKMESESIDMIFCDPPYDEGAIPLYGELAERAKRVLKVGG